MSNFEVHEKRPGYFVARRAHPLGTGKVLTAQGRDKLVLELWAREIEAIAAKYKAGIMTASQVVAAIAKMEGQGRTVQDAWDDMIAGVKNQNSRIAYAQAWDHWLKPTFTTMKLEEVTESELDEWKTKCEAQTTARGTAPKPRTIAFAWSVLKQALRREIKAGRLSVVPWGDFKVKVPNPKGERREALETIEEVRALVVAAAEHDAQHAIGYFGDIAIRLVVLLFTGLRNAELGAIGWDDLILRKNGPMLRVRYQVLRGWPSRYPDRPRDPTKTGVVAEVPLHIEVLKALKAQKLALQRATPCNGCGAAQGRACSNHCDGAKRGFWRADGPVFPGKGGQWRKHPQTLHPRRVRELVRLALPHVDADRFCTHSTRHTFASLVYELFGGNARNAMELTRHADVDAFKGYLHTVGRNVTNPMPSIDVEYGEAVYELNDVESGAYHATTSEHDEETIVEVMDEREQKMVVWKEERDAKRRRDQNLVDKRYRASNATDFDTAYAAWTVAGRPGKRPSQVTAAARQVYDRVRKSHDRNGPEKPDFKVPRDVRRWDALVHEIRMLKTQKEDGETAQPKQMEGWIDELKALNPGVEKLRPGLVVRIPREWDAGRVAIKAKWRYLGAWAKFVKERDASSGPEMTQMVKGQLPKRAESEHEGDEP